jgi:hypothetical protein
VSINNDWGDVIANEARKWEGTAFRSGVKEQCMNWVRYVLERVHHPYAARTTAEPVDKHWTGPSLASSLAGRDLGAVVTKIAALEPGDVLFWDDTYSTGFPPQTITHVGIALGPDRFIHRNTMAAPVNVQPYAGMWRSHFRCALRVPQTIKADAAVKAPVESATAKIWLNTGGSALQIRQELDRGRYSLYSTGSCSDGAWLIKAVEAPGKVPAANEASRLWINDNGATLELRQDLAPGSYHLVSAGSEIGGALLVKMVKR